MNQLIIKRFWDTHKNYLSYRAKINACKNNNEPIPQGLYRQMWNAWQKHLDSYLKTYN